ncbi:A disintegrin and metalloproteinase with thrombospondin motifs 9 isoform X2 [Macrobrachium rosenbergii]|uniref:A disintegrin and metalloproteinase with thrombospondin motifs 9 isoform X2 n=1 Tax=Macrobrachium rosenbergii TaxID=79674 RepID=UPI0034D5D142
MYIKRDREKEGTPKIRSRSGNVSLAGYLSPVPSSMISASLGKCPRAFVIIFACGAIVAIVFVWTFCPYAAGASSSSQSSARVDRAEGKASPSSPSSPPSPPPSSSSKIQEELVWVNAKGSQMPNESDGGRGRGKGLVYKWAAADREWKVQVWPDTKFMAPTILLRHESARESVVIPPTHNAHCFYSGVVLGAREVSAVGINVCKGLTGVIQLGNAVYLIEPAGSTIKKVQESEAEEEEEEEEEELRNIYGNGESETSDKDGGEVISVDHQLVDSDYPVFEDGSELHLFTRALWNGSLSGHDDHPSSSGHTRHHHPPTGSNRSSQDTHEDRFQDSPREPSLVGHCDAQGDSFIDKLQAEAPWSTTQHHHRARRFLYSQRYSIEVLVVVDNKMARYHGKHVNQYVLTLMSVVALIFRDPSIGNRIDIAVVEVVRPERQSFTPKRPYGNSAEVSGISAEEMLKMFCKWQKQGLKYNINHQRRYDTALLLTRENICRNPYTKSCDTLGLAELGTMCSKHSSCAIVQDNGLSAVFTIAHELGHLLNMPHDNDDKCALLGGGEDSNQRMNVMSRMLDHNTLPWVWSNCSRHYLTEYLHGGHGRCLEDEPWTNKLIEENTEFTLAGERFNASKQCQYVFGKSSKICPYMPTCKRLWCTTSLDEKEGCRTQHMPWADGTHCDNGMWCLRGQCVQKNKNIMRKIDGKWGDWGAWSTCSRTCGVGVRRSERLCNTPAPKYGGRYCTGERVKYESCKLRACSTGSIDFRTQQCQVYNNKTFGLPDIPDDVKWIPKYAGIRREDSCKLFCQVYNSSRKYFQLREKVEDGTPCGPDTYDICVNGVCHIAGCDYVLNSTAKADNCGVCKGDNSTCHVTEGSVTNPRRYGYSDITVIPEGAARIDITQRSYHDRPNDDNYLALVDLETGEYLLNGHWIVTPFPKLIEFGGTMLEYTGSNAITERINSTKPMKKKLLVQLLSVGDLNPPNIVYSFTKSTMYSNPNYYWRLGDLSNCSEPCIGKRQRTPYCVRADSGTKVRDDLCPSDQKPAPLQESCAHTCPVHWSYSDWSKCELNGEQCMRRREVTGCVSSLGNKVDEERCAKDRQYTHEECPREECPSWKYFDWSPCSCEADETEGIQQRPYACQLRERPLQKWECRELDKPSFIRNCSCWYAEQWMPGCELDSQHGSGPSLEDHRDQDITRLEEAIDTWTVGGGGGGGGDRETDIDTPNCGTGVKRRHVYCGSPESGLPMSSCDAHTKPSEFAPCSVPCPTTTTTTTTSTTTTTPKPTTTPTTTASSITTHTTSSPTLTHVPSSVSSSHVNRSPVLKGGKQHKTTLTLGSDWNHPQYPERSKTPWTAGVDSQREANDIPNNLPMSLDERERLSRDDFMDNRVSTSRLQTEGYSITRNRNSPSHSQHQSSEEEFNNEVQQYDPDIVPHLHPTNWQTGGWTACSRDCGVGEKFRQVVCFGSKELCRPEDRPVDRMACNTHLCAEWTTGDWGHCRTRRRRCGRGKQERLVACRDPNGPQLDEDHCHAADKPTHIRTCKVPCGNNSKRRGRRQRYKWKTGDWSPCSSVCGPGVETRNVTCHAVNSHNWVDPEPVSRGCRESKRPRDTRKCSLGSCSSGYSWKVKPWKKCQGSCGERGRQRRSVNCVNSSGRKVHRSLCSKEVRPRRKQKCRNHQCGFTSCEELRQPHRMYVDGEYSILVGGRNMSIFCYGMNSTSPREYLTLPAGEEGNFAEFYNKILLQPNTCPHVGERLPECDCELDQSGRSGYTTFSKIRLNVTTLLVDTIDFTFARALEGALIPYGEAGDCFSMAECPQGAFSINLAGTPLAVSPRTNWLRKGSNAVHWINRLDDNQRILGRCGGYCGTCAPDPSSGLKLHLRDG